MLALLGCDPMASDPTGPDAAASGPAVELREVRARGGFVVIELMIPLAPPGPKPAVINPIVDEAVLLERGIVVVRAHYDARAAPWKAELERRREAAERSGDAEPEASEATRVGSWMLASPRPGILGRSYFILVHDSARYLDSVLDHLESMEEVDAERIGVAGSSTGGFVALEALMQHPRLAAAVVRAACGDYRDFLKKSSLALAGEDRWLVEGRLPLDASYSRELDEQEPIRFPERFPPRPLLLLNGARDPAIPASCARRTAEILAPEYERRGVADRFRFVLYEEAGHNLGPASLEAALHWWERWLLSDSDTPGAR